jgi:hypothetical protein
MTIVRWLNSFTREMTRAETLRSPLSLGECAGNDALPLVLNAGSFPSVHYGGQEELPRGAAA